MAGAVRHFRCGSRSAGGRRPAPHRRPGRDPEPAVLPRLVAGPPGDRRCGLDVAARPAGSWALKTGLGLICGSSPRGRVAAGAPPAVSVRALVEAPVRAESRQRDWTRWLGRWPAESPRLRRLAPVVGVHYSVESLPGPSGVMIGMLGVAEPNPASAPATRALSIDDRVMRRHGDFAAPLQPVLRRPRAITACHLLRRLGDHRLTGRRGAPPASSVRIVRQSATRRLLSV